MTQQMVLALGQNALVITLMLAGPILLVSMLVGLTVSIFQAVTQINEMTLTFIPKLAAIFVVLLVFGPWMMNVMLSYTQALFLQVSTLTPH